MTSNGPLISDPLPTTPRTKNVDSAISVVIRTFNSAHTLEAVLENLDLIEGDEVIIVDSGSTDATLDIARRFGAKIERLSGPFHYSTALNAGFSKARNPWVLALSSHCIPAIPDFLGGYRIIVQTLPREVASVCGVCATDPKKIQNPGVPTASFFSLSTVNERLWELPISNGNNLYRRSIWLQHPFSLEVRTAEDMEWGVWAALNGYSLGKTLTQVAFYNHRGTISGLYQKGLWETIEVARVTGKTEFQVHFLKELFFHSTLWLRKRMPLGSLVRRAAYCMGIKAAKRYMASHPIDRLSIPVASPVLPKSI